MVLQIRSEDFSTWDQISSYFVKIVEKKDYSGKNGFRSDFCVDFSTPSVSYGGFLAV